MSSSQRVRRYRLSFCAEGQHRSCPHLVLDSSDTLLRRSGDVLRRCTCGCHAGCPAGALPAADGYAPLKAACTCWQTRTRRQTLAPAGRPAWAARLVRVGGSQVAVGFLVGYPAGLAVCAGLVAATLTTHGTVHGVTVALAVLTVVVLAYVSVSLLATWVIAAEVDAVVRRGRHPARLVAVETLVAAGLGAASGSLTAAVGPAGLAAAPLLVLAAWRVRRGAGRGRRLSPRAGRYLFAYTLVAAVSLLTVGAVLLIVT